MDAEVLAVLAAVLAWDGDVDGTQQAPVDGGGAMAQDSTRTRGEHRRHPACLFAEAVVADGIDTSVDAMHLSAAIAL